MEESGNAMSLVSLCALALGFGVGGIGGIILGFIWYEHKCGLLSDHSGKRATSIQFELDDVFRPMAQTGGSVIPLQVADSRLPRA
jgi:hypothetical protein